MKPCVWLRPFFFVSLAIVPFLLSSCGGKPASKYTIGGTVSGLSGSGLVLQDNGGDNLPVSANGSFTFATAVASGAAYSVTVLTQPSSPAQVCTVANGSGKATANVTNVQIACTTETYTIGGTVSGLSGAGLVLEDNGADKLPIAVNGSFTFPTALDSGAAYNVTVLTQPSGPAQVCTVSNGTGTANANVTNVQIACTTTTYTIGGNVSGLSGSGLVLQDNGGDNLPVSANGGFTFPTALDSGAAYNVTVLTQPSSPAQVCTVANGTGTATAKVTNVQIACVTTTYTIGGNVSGLSGSGLVLQDNGSDNLPVSANGGFTFPTALDSGAAYNVTVFTQPSSPAQLCTVSNGSGNASANVINVQVACVTTNSQTVGPAGGTFTFANGAVTLTFPAGALPANTVVTVTSSTAASGSPIMIGSSAYTFAPEGIFFAAPVYVTIAYDPTAIPSGVAESSLRVAKLSSGAWDGLVVSSVDTSAHTATGLLTGFSTYAVGDAPLTPFAPPAIPATPDPSGFANVYIVPAVTGDATQINTENTGPDLIAQYGGTGNVTEVASVGAGSSWLLQVCGGTTCTQNTSIGSGNTISYQFATGSGPATQLASGGTSGNATFIQAGGLGYNTFTVNDGDNLGTAHVEIYGGPAGNAISADGTQGNDLIAIYGGAGDDAITYNMSAGNDTVIVNGGGGTNTLVVNNDGATNYTIKDSSGDVLFTSGSGGTTIWIANIEGIQVLDKSGNLVFTWGIPPLAPVSPTIPNSSGYNVINDPSVTGDATQIANGTAANDLITQYGGTGNVTEIASGGGGNDWILQQCGGTSCNENASVGDGNSTVYQYATGSGPAIQTATGGTTSAQTFIQVGGIGFNRMSVSDGSSSGTAKIEMYGGPAGNTMTATGSQGNDVISMYGGAGNDSFTYDMTAGSDTVIVDGGGGTNTLIVNTDGYTSYTIQDGSGNVIYSSGSGGTMISVANIQGIEVIGPSGNLLFTSGIPPLAPVLPTPPSASGYNVINDPSVTGDATQIAIGTSANDLITQYGGTGTVAEMASGGGGNDWILQQCGGTSCNENASVGDGNSTVYQYVTGSGPAIQTAVGGTSGNQTFIQVGGLGVNTMSVDASNNTGTAQIEMYGGPAGNTMTATGSQGNYVISMYGGAGNDSFTYNMTGGSDTVIVDGGGGANTFIVDTEGWTNYTIRNGSGNVIYSSGSGGTTISAANIQGIEVLDQNGNLIFTSGIPPIAPVIPTVPPASGFSNVMNDPLVTGDVTQQAFGTTANDLITQYGGTGNVSELASGGGGNDWILQTCGGTSCAENAAIGAGNSTIYQFDTGSGPASMTATGGTSGTQTFVQVGGLGYNTLSVNDESNTGTAVIEMYGGPVGNTMQATGSQGNDVIDLYGGAGNDAFTYDLTTGNDAVLVNGGGGTNTLVVNTEGATNYTIQNAGGSVIVSSGASGTTISVANIQGIEVLDQNGNPIFAWGVPPLPPPIPAIPDASGFSNVINDPAVTGDADQIAFGTTANDLITQYGGTGTVIETAAGGGGNDWVLQECGGTSCTETANMGDGNSTVYQYATGSGPAIQTVTNGTSGAMTSIQVGGQGANQMQVNASTGTGGTAQIQQYGGPAGNTLSAEGTNGNDSIAMYGGAGVDAFTYDITGGNDTVIVNGGGGTADTLTVNNMGNVNYTLQDGAGKVIFASGTGGTTITVLNVVKITVLNQQGNTIFTTP